MRHKRVTNKKQSVNQRLDNNSHTRYVKTWNRTKKTESILIYFVCSISPFTRHFWTSLHGNSPQHQESFAKNCDICNARAARVQGTYKSASPQAKNLTKSVSNSQVDEDTVYFSNSSTSRQITLSSSKSLDSEDKGELDFCLYFQLITIILFSFCTYSSHVCIYYQTKLYSATNG